MEENQLIDEILAPSAVNVSSNYIQVGDRFSRTIFISNYPRFLNSGWFSNVINLDQELNIAFHIHPEDTAAILKKLRDRLARLQAQAIEEQEKGRVRDPVLETAIADIEDLTDKLQLGTDRFFRFGLYVTILGKDLKELDEVEKKIRNSMEAQLISVRPATFRMKEGFTSTLPLGKDELGILSPLNTEPISSSFPFVSYDMTQDQGILYGINLHNNSLILFDRFSLENANEVLFGTQIFVIDPEHEYKHVAETLGGSFIKISIASETHINPFDLPSPREDERLEDVFRSHILDLTGLMRVMLGQLSAEEESVLDEALIQTYAIKDIYPDRDFSGKEPPLMGDFQNVLENMEGAQSLVIRIKKYTEGTFFGFLNRPTNVTLDNQLVVF